MENVNAACALAYERELFSGRRFSYFSSGKLRYDSISTNGSWVTCGVNQLFGQNLEIKTRACESQMSNTERPSEPMIIL